MILTWSLLKSRKFDSDDNIDVGAELYEIDTEAEASTSAPEASSEKPAAAVAAAPASVPEPAKPPVPTVLL
jgi:pyruvate/2-oxoglutarate dehydrogenase complex dihydrolipoamide acyltransferase (E2) component